jgi:hypothetical protein
MKTGSTVSRSEQTSACESSQRTRVILERLLCRPELQLLTTGITLTVQALAGQPFIVPAQDQLVLAPESLACPHAAVILRHGLELARLRRIAPHAPSLCGLLAARTALHYLSFEPGLQADPLLAQLEALNGSLPGVQVLARLWAILAKLQPDTATSFDLALRDLLTATWPLAMPAEKLMTMGGDERLILDPSSGLNKYGCGTRPTPGAAAFGSCTASTISKRGYGAAEACRQRLLHAALGGRIAQGYSAESQAIRSGVLHYYQAEDLADAVLAASGTDATLLATLLMHARAPDKKLTAILMSPTETGSGVLHAAAGRHFAVSTVFQRFAAPGAHLAGLDAAFPVRIVPLRTSARPCRQDDIHAAIAREIAEAIAEDHCVLLHMIHTSKTGLRAADLAYARHLKKTYGARLDIVVDACQARLAPTNLRAYLQAGLAVLLTGSKFFTGPAFSGILLTPRGNLADTLHRLPHGIAGYSSQFDWATAPSVSSTGLNGGLLLRWAAALAEMTAFAAIAPKRQTRILKQFGQIVQRHLTSRGHFIAPAANLALQSEHADWDDQPTIFSFGLTLPSVPGRSLNMAELAQVHRWLYSDISHCLPGRLAARPCQIGQPVQLDLQPGSAAGVLRIAAGARLVSDSLSDDRLNDHAYFECLDTDVNDVFEKIAIILGDLPTLRASLKTDI